MTYGMIVSLMLVAGILIADVAIALLSAEVSKLRDEVKQLRAKLEL